MTRPNLTRDEALAHFRDGTAPKCANRAEALGRLDDVLRRFSEYAAHQLSSGVWHEAREGDTVRSALEELRACRAGLEPK